MKNKSFYITTTLPYVNAPLHLGHATEIIRADAIARYKKLMGFDVFFNTGTDEHGMKIYESAIKAGKSPEEYTDYYANLYKETLHKFGVLEDTHYTRTTNPDHIKSAQEFWKKCNDAGFIYKKNYQAKYCIGCEEEKTDSELVDGKCPEHNRVPELINEENYFFKLSAFEKQLLDFYDKNPEFIIPETRMNEMREFIKRGLRDFSISRLKSKVSWGIEVPGDSEHVMYVWFDALVNYISVLGWPNEERDFKKYWVEGTPTQFCGKNNTRFQGVMWQAMLMAAGFSQENLTKKIVVDGFILGDGGVKMSKSLGNAIDPLEIVNEYGSDALRYFVLREFHPFEDTAVSKEKLKESYNANLANGLGNLVSRVLKMSESYGIEYKNKIFNNENDGFYKVYMDSLGKFDVQSAMDMVWVSISWSDRHIQQEQPFKKIKVDKEGAKKDIEILLSDLMQISEMLEPLLPETSKKIRELIKNNKSPEKPLFARKD